MCGLFWGAHKSLAPRARTLLGGLGQATLSSFAVATLLFVLFGECPIFCDLAKQRRKIVGGVSEFGKDDFSLYFFWRCVIFLVFYFSSAAIARRCLCSVQFIQQLMCLLLKFRPWLHSRGQDLISHQDLSRPLDLSPSHEEGTSFNVISDDEQPEDVAKELFPLAETTAHTAKGKGAQEPQHQVEVPVPPTNSEKVQDSVPEGTHENTEGNHPCDAEELKQQEESREDPCGDSAMNNNAALNDNAKRTNEVEPDNSLLTPREEQSTPSAIPSPEGTHEKAEDGEDPTPDERDGNSGKPFFNPSLAPDSVFAKFLVEHKGEINTHDQQALWGETHVHDTLGVDTNQLVLEKHHKQVIYNQVRPTIDLCASDGCTFFHDIDCSGNNAYSTIGHDNFRYLKDILHHHPKFYIFPHPQDYYNSKYKYGNTWTEWAHAINEALQEAFDSGVVYEGSFILPGMEDNLSAETLYMNPLNPGMISLAPWVCGVDRLSDANTYNPSPTPDGSVRLNLLDSPQYPYFHLHLSTRHKHHAHIRYGDIMHPHTSLQWAINKVDGTVQVAAVRTTL